MKKELRKEIIKEYKKNFPVKKFIPSQSPVPVSGKIFDEEEMFLMTEAVLDGWWTEGRFNKEFEEKLAKFIGTKYCLTVNSGSSANLAALTALTSPMLGKKAMKKGDEVITVAAGFPTTVNPIIQAGCVPVFVDIEMKTLSIDASQLGKALSKKTKAIFLAHTLGNPFDIEKVMKFCKDNNLWLIEDNCDALGSEYKNKRTGIFGDISTLSFFPAHHITTGEGGAVLTGNPLLYKIIRSIRDWGRDCQCPTGHDDTCKKRFKQKWEKLPDSYDHKYVYSHLGYNLKMTDIQAACGLAQMKKLEKFIGQRKGNYKILKEKLSRYGEYFDIAEPGAGSDPSWFGLPISLKDNCGFSRENFMKYLNRKKIGTRLLFAGNITKQPYFINNKIKYRQIGTLGNTDKVMKKTFWIGVYPGVTKPMTDWVEKSFNDYLKDK
jgi:CDP-4-dehydro-6-deoxyglucose reductase, E1